MALPTAYLNTARNVEPLFNAIRNAKAPTKFTQRFLESLDFKSTNDRLFINVFKALGLLSGGRRTHPSLLRFSRPDPIWTGSC